MAWLSASNMIQIIMMFAKRNWFVQLAYSEIFESTNVSKILNYEIQDIYGSKTLNWKWNASEVYAMVILSL